MNISDRPFRKARQGFAVTESYCPACGMFIAASPQPKILALAESLHRCFPWRSGMLDGGRCSAEAAIVAYAFGKGQPGSNLFLQSEFVRLKGKLARQEPALNRWLRHSEMNANWFFQDPIAALRAANLGIDEELLKELESATSAIAQRNKANP